MSRIIIINSSNGIPSQQIETIAQTWVELQEDMNTAGINYSGMKAIIGETKGELAADNALLPEGSFNLFLLPKKTKSGSQSKSSIKNTEMATAKKAAPIKKSVPAKKEIAPKKIATKKSSVSLKGEKETIVKEEKKIDVSAAIANSVKSMKDIDRITDAIVLLKSIEDSNVKTRLARILEELDDCSYIIATGKPRIDNLKTKKTAQELCNTNSFGTQC